MMQPAQQRLRDDSKADRQAMIVCPFAGRLTLGIRDARSQTRMRASVVVMSDPFREYAADVPLVERNHPIQTLTTNRADQPFAIRIGVGRQLHCRRAVRPKPFVSHTPSIRYMAASSN